MNRSVKRFIGVICVMLAVIVSTASGAVLSVSAAEPELTDIMETLYSHESGIPTNEANTIVETRDGYIWTGGYGGLLRYDGRSFENFSRSDTGMTSSSIRALFEDSSGTLWVGTNEQGVFYYDGNRFIRVSDPESTEYLSVRCFTESGGVLYVGTTEGIARIDGHKLVGMDIERLNNQTVYTLSTDPDGGMWGVESSGSLFCVKDGQVACWFSPGVFWNNYAYCATVTDDGRICIGTNTEELVILTRTGERMTSSDFSYKRIIANGCGTINYLCETVEGQLWLCCDNATGYVDLTDYGFHLASYVKNAEDLGWMIQDHEGNLWMTSSTKGVIKLSHGAYSRMYLDHVITDQVINAVNEYNGYYYVGAKSGLYIFDSQWRAVSYPITQLLSNIEIRNIAIDHTGCLWFSTYYGPGAVRYNPSTGEIKTFGRAEGISGDKIRMALPLSNGDIAVSTGNGIDIIRGDSVIAHYGAAQGMKNSFILCMVELSDGTILAGSDGLGLYTVKDGVVTNYYRNIGLAGGVILHIIPDDRSENLWISTGAELYYGNLTDGMKQTAELSKGSGSIFDLYFKDDYVWVLRNSSVVRTTRDALLNSDIAQCTEFGQSLGLTAPLVANSWSLLSDDKFVVCTTSGISKLNAVGIDETAAAPIIVLNSIYSDNDRMPSTDKIAIDSSAQKLTIDLAVLSYNQHPVDIVYKLDGFNSEWTTIPHGSYSPIVYTNLSGGNYTFRYKAIGSDGIVSEEKTIVIAKEKSLFEHVWVWLILAAALTGAAFLAARIIMNAKVTNAKKRQEQYKNITDQGLLTIANTIDAKDAYTNGHSRRVAAYSRELAKRYGYDDPEALYYVALLHDIGKIGIPDKILNKPGKLTPDEYKLIQKHPVIGGEILKDFTAVPGIVQGAMYHHERYDGTGYCQGLAGEDIPVAARIIGVADAYDAMSSARCYRPRLDTETIINELREGSSTQFDPVMAQIMLDMIADGTAEKLAETSDPIEETADDIKMEDLK